MIVLMRDDATSEAVDAVIRRARELGFEAHVNRRGTAPVIVLDGDSSLVDEGLLQLPGVATVRRVSPPYARARRGSETPRTVVNIGGVRVGGDALTIIAGPCAVEGRSQLLPLAARVKAAGAQLLRGGAFKPRTSPYAFKGLAEEGLELLAAAREQTGLPVVSEILSERQIDVFEKWAIDAYQVGARNMYNYPLLTELGRLGKPVLLKRAFSATIEELLLAAEYLLSAGNERVVLCERGVRSFEPSYRFMLDLNAVAYLADQTHLPIIVDPSHGTGDRRLVERLALAAVAAGADGLIVEVHESPDLARSDGAQQITPDTFETLATRAADLRAHLTREPAVGQRFSAT